MEIFRPSDDAMTEITMDVFQFKLLIQNTVLKFEIIQWAVTKYYKQHLTCTFECSVFPHIVLLLVKEELPLSLDLVCRKRTVLEERLDSNCGPTECCRR